MRLLFICPRFDKSAGDGAYATRLSLALSELGSDVHIFTVRDDWFVHLHLSNSVVGTNKASDEKIKFLEKTRNGFFSKNFYGVSARRSLRDILNAIKPDLIHIHGIHQYFTISCVLELRKYGKPVVMTVHDYKIVCGNAGLFSDRTNTPCIKCLRGRFLPPIFERCKKNSYILSVGASVQMAMWRFLRGLTVVNSFLVGSKSTHELLSMNHELSPKLEQIMFPNYPQLPTRISGASKLSIGFIGRFVPLKGITIFAEAVKYLDLPIHIFGSGPQEAEARAILAGKKNVFFHDWRSSEEISQYLKMGSVIVLPYLAYENTCLTLVECMCRGCCVIGTMRGFIAELITHDYNGILVEQPTAENFRKAIDSVLAKPERITAYGKRAIETVATLSDLQSHAIQILKHYETVLSA